MKAPSNEPSVTLAVLDVYKRQSEKFYSLPTPASFNTPMGITITIREQLKPTHEVFILSLIHILNSILKK